PPAPRMVGLELVAPGLVFASGGEGPDTNTPLADVRSATLSSGTVPATGTLAILTIDVGSLVTANPAPGSGGKYVLSLQNQAAGFQTDALNAQAQPIPETLGTATITIVPEPTTMLLLIGAL